jgi:exonuclease SbcC
MAAALRSGLAKGDPCPVCAQDVGDLPPELAAPDLEDAEKAHASAIQQREVAEAARREAGEEHATAVQAAEAAVKAAASLEEEATAATGDVETADGAVAKVEAALTGLLGKGEADGLLTAKREAYEALVAASVTAREAADRARSEHDQAIRDEQAAGKALSALQVDLVDLAARIGIPAGAAETDPQGVGSQLVGLSSAWEEAVKAGEQGKREAVEAGQKARSDRDALLASVEVEGDLASALSDVTARAELLQADIGRREAELRDGAALMAEHVSAAAVHAIHERIASDLTDARFVRYLLDDERTRLAALGSEHFLRLSSGRYLFSGDGRFDIVDQTAAEAVRKADSLSGGETFLASLALALSLAEMVARSGGRLDAFFLDEGFGTLDPEHLDLAMEGIESLVADGAGRLVVVVSHVPEMRDRVEDLIVLDRDAATGDTIIRQD